MSYELLVTSAKRALQAGRSGFAAVMRTRGMHPELQSRLEALSGYRHLFPQGDPRNPVIIAHSVIDSVAGSFSVFSRTVDAGSDYSGRSNKLSHHLALDASELRSATRSSPAATVQWLQRNGRFASGWESDPRELEPGPPIVFPPSEPAKCVAWEKVGGDAGWAGMLVDRTLKGLSTWIIVPADVDAVGLLAEAMALLEPSKRWAVSFTTHAMSDTGFVWKVAAEGSTEAKVARELNPAAVIDLTRPARAGDEGPYAQAARGLSETPWKRSVAAKPVPSSPPGSHVRSSEESHGGTAPAIRHAEAIGARPALRPAPPPLIKPPPVVRPPDMLGDTKPFPVSARGFLVTRVNTPLLAAAFAVGITVAVLLGLLVDAQIRGEGSVIRKVAALIPREDDEQPRGLDTTADASQTRERSPDSRAQNDRPGRHHSPVTQDGAATAEADPKTTSSALTQDTTPPSTDAKELSLPTPSLQIPEKPRTNGVASPFPQGTTVVVKSDEGAFETVRNAVEAQRHLPQQALGDSAADAEGQRMPGKTLVVFKRGTAMPSIERLLLVPADGRLTIDSLPGTSMETRWTCRMTGDSNAPVEVGAFVLNANGISFEAVTTQPDIVDRLSKRCLLILGKNGSESTYLQLSRPIEVASVPFTLQHRNENSDGVLQAQVTLPLPSKARLGDLEGVGDVSLRITGTSAPDAPSFTLLTSSFTPPLVGHQAVRFTVDQSEVQMRLDYRVTADTNSLSLELVAGAFADKPHFDRLSKAISNGGNINFELVFWPFARSELLKALPKTADKETGRTKSGTQQARALSSLQERLKPPKKAAATFTTYVEALRDALLSSPSLLSQANAIVDKRHPPPPPAQEKGDTEGRGNETRNEEKASTFDREAEVGQEKVSQFAAWCEERLSELEAQRQKWETPDGPKWTDEDFNDYAALILWSRIQHLEQCVKAFHLPEAPKAVTGAASCEVRRVWPARLLPEGVSCRPETLLLRTTP